VRGYYEEEERLLEHSNPDSLDTGIYTILIYENRPNATQQFLKM
jgi:hypothetical protein